MADWICVRQRAGPLVKECRYQRPTLRKGDLPSVQREKQKILSMTKGALFRRTPEDRLELMLGLFGWGATVYTLTFNDAQLPHSFRRRERRTMDEYITLNYKTIGTVEQRKIRELYTSSLLNAFTQQDYLDAIALIGRVIDRLEKLEK